MKKLLSNYLAAVLLIILGCTGQVMGQTGGSGNNYMVAFYNVENLFDTINDPNKNDEEFTPGGDKQWNTERYKNKLENLAKVISGMNGGKGPDVLGLCEIENFKVLKDLVNTKALKGMHYGIVHQESRDDRGIDIALLYKEDVLPWVSFTTFPVPLPDSVPPTRDIMLVQTEVEGQSLNFIVCHFPSRSEGKEKSEYKRTLAARVVRHTIDSLLEADPNDNTLVMGDFNDEPADYSIREVIGACNPDVSDDLCHILNATYGLKTKGLGTYKYREEWNMLDQVIMNANLYNGNKGLMYVPESAAIYAQEWMKQTEPKYQGSPLRTFGGMKYLAGYSDHFPVYVFITVKQ